MRRSSADVTALPPALIDEAQGWASVWGVPALMERVAVDFSTRLRTTLGRCVPALGRITLHASLRSGDDARLREVLCHELAHVAAFRLHGSAVRAHGPEWSALVLAVGFQPRMQLDVPGSGAARAAVSSRFRYLHACPVCQTRRYGRRPVRRWRCAECVAAGLSGELEINRVESRGDV